MTAGELEELEAWMLVLRDRLRAPRGAPSLEVEARARLASILVERALGEYGRGGYALAAEYLEEAARTAEALPIEGAAEIAGHARRLAGRLRRLADLRSLAARIELLAGEAERSTAYKRGEEASLIDEAALHLYTAVAHLRRARPGEALEELERAEAALARAGLRHLAGRTRAIAAELEAIAKGAGSGGQR